MVDRRNTHAQTFSIGCIKTNKKHDFGALFKQIFVFFRPFGTFWCWHQHDVTLHSSIVRSVTQQLRWTGDGADTVYYEAEWALTQTLTWDWCKWQGGQAISSLHHTAFGTRAVSVRAGSMQWKQAMCPPIRRQYHFSSQGNLQTAGRLRYWYRLSNLQGLIGGLTWMVSARRIRCRDLPIL